MAQKDIDDAQLFLRRIDGALARIELGQLTLVVQRRVRVLLGQIKRSSYPSKQAYELKDFVTELEFMAEAVESFRSRDQDPVDGLGHIGTETLNVRKTERERFELSDGRSDPSPT